MSKSQAFFIELSELKTLLSVSSIEILSDKETGKKSFKVGSNWFRVQTDIDTKKPIRFLTSEVLKDGSPDWLQGCLVNIDDSKAKKITFEVI